MFSMKKIALAVLLMAGTVFTSATAMADLYEVDITISNLGDFNLAAFNIDVSYDDILVTFDSYTLTGELGSLEDADSDGWGDEAEDWSFGDDLSGTVNISVVSYLVEEDLDTAFFATQSNDFVLATLAFYADDESCLDGISLSYIELSDEYGEAIPFTLDGANINAVPAPGALWLMGSAILGIAGFRRRATS